MPRFSKKHQEEAICPTCGDWKTTDFTPEELKERDWQCTDCEEKQFNPPAPEQERGSQPITKYDPEFEFLTKLITLVTNQGIPVEEIKAITDKYRPLSTVDQAGDLAAEIWTLATTKYQIPREWLIKKLPDAKKKANLNKKADAYNNPQEQWPAQAQAEDFSDRPVNSYAYEPEKVSSTPEQDKKTLMSIAWDLVVERFFGAHARWSDVMKELKDMYPALQDEDIAQLRDQVKHSLDVQTNNIRSKKPQKEVEIPKEGDAGNPDAGTGFYDTPGGADLGKRPEGDFPSSSWMPSGTADMDAEYWDNIDSALSKKDLNKTSSLTKVAANDFIAQVDVDGLYLKDLFGEEVSFEQPVNIRWALEFEMREWGVKGAYVHVPDQEVTIVYQTDTTSDQNPNGGYEDRSRKVALQNVKIEGVDHASYDSVLTPRTLSFDGKSWVVDFGNYLTSGLSKKEITKKSRMDKPAWIDPSGKVYELSNDTHETWVDRNMDLLKNEYKINFKKMNPKRDSGVSFLVDNGWARASVADTALVFQVKNTGSLGNLDAYVDQHWGPTYQYVLIESQDDNHTYQVNDPFPSLTQTIQKATMIASLKKADLNGKTVNDILLQIESTGGATYNMSRGNLAGQEMFAVSIYPDRERIEEIATFDDIENYIQANMDLLGDSSNSFGAWAHDGKVYFDVIATVPDQAEAIELGRKHNQLAIFDLKNKQEIPTGVKRDSSQKQADASSPLTQEDQDEIAASSSPVYNIALNNYYDALKRGHSKDRSLAYAVDSVKNLEQIDPKKLIGFANTYLSGLI